MTVKLETAPRDRRVPTQNQAKACYMYYNSWHQCKYDFSEDEPQCKRRTTRAAAARGVTGASSRLPPVNRKLNTWAHAMCPDEWFERWEAQREAGTYAGPVPGEKEGGH
mmetsp:Transcript_7526/g.24054  ORF Transcript_7526/g.24054 Transcript_7526/m.24054 type:complete len:109 (+) Transcript_7526:49-375(+)